MQDEYPLISDPVYDFSTSCTKSEAVKFLLGWPRETISENWLPKNATPEELELCDYTWETLLTNERNFAETAYSNAKMERKLQERDVTDEEIAEKLAELEKCDVKIKRAHHYKCLIDDELAKDDPALRIDHKATINPEYPFITLVSLDKWAKKQKIKTFDSQDAQKELQDDSIQKGGLSKTKANNLQITFALLVEAFAKTGPKYNKGNDYPNVNSIADHLENLAKNAGRQSGQGNEVIKTRIEDAMKIFRDPPI